MNLKDIFNNLIKFHLSDEFEEKIFVVIQKRKRLYEVIYPFVYGFIAPVVLGIIGIVVFQIGSNKSLSIIVGLLGLMFFALILYRISNLWRQIKSF